MAARLRGKRRAAKSSVLHARGRRGTLPWHRPGRVCRTKTPVALSSRAHRDNAAVHPSVTRRHCRVVPGSTRSCTRGAPGAHKGNTQGAAGSRPGRARVEPHRLHFRRKFSSWWRHGPHFAPASPCKKESRNSRDVQLSTDRRSDSPPVRRFALSGRIFRESAGRGGDQHMFSRWMRVRRGIDRRIQDRRRSERTQPGRAPHTEAGPWSRTCALRPAPSGRARTADEAEARYKRIRWTTPDFSRKSPRAPHLFPGVPNVRFIALGIAKHTFRAADSGCTTLLLRLRHGGAETLWPHTCVPQGDRAGSCKARFCA